MGLIFAGLIKTNKKKTEPLLAEIIVKFLSVSLQLAAQLLHKDDNGDQSLKGCYKKSAAGYYWSMQISTQRDWLDHFLQNVAIYLFAFFFVLGICNYALFISINTITQNWNIPAK